MSNPPRSLRSPLLITSFLVTSVLTLAVAAALAGCGRPPLAPQVTVPPAVVGESEPIYFGSVYPLGEPDAPTPTYVYERRVATKNGAIVASHITREAAGSRSGAVVLAESATSTPAYALSDYVLHGDQHGHTGSVHVEPGRVVFRLREGSEEQTVEEEQDGVVVVGPTLVGWIAVHLDALRAGKTFDVRLAVLDRLETIGFELAQEPAAAGQTRIRMTPTSLLVGLVLDPIHYTFETSTRKLVRLEGRVPPQLRVGDDLEDFDARVEYAFVAPTYR